MNHYGPMKKNATSSNIDFKLLYYVIKKIQLVLDENHTDNLKMFLIEALVDQVKKRMKPLLINRLKRYKVAKCSIWKYTTN